MDCNNILTDSQLEAMFATIEEEMRQIKQPIEYPTQVQEMFQIPLQRSYTQEASL